MPNIKMKEIQQQNKVGKYDLVFKSCLSVSFIYFIHGDQLFPPRTNVSFFTTTQWSSFKHVCMCEFSSSING